MLSLSVVFVALFVTLGASIIQRNLESTEDLRAGSLSILRAGVFVLAGAILLVLPSGEVRSWIVAILFVAAWFLQQLLGRLLGLSKAANRLTQVSDGLVSTWALLVSGIRLSTPEAAEEYEQDLIESVEEFSETVVREIMVPRVDLEVIDAESTLEKALSVFVTSGYSRLPVVGEDVDDVVGVLYLKDLARIVHQDPALLAAKDARSAARKAVFIPESKSVAELLQEMQLTKTQIAIAVDEYGGVAGIVTIEDLIEELVGEIEDEYDDDEQDIVEISTGLFRVSPRVTLDELGEHCGIELEDEDIDTVGGLLIKAVGELPRGGEVVQVLGLELTAEKVDAKRRNILSITVRKLEQ